MGQYLPSIFCIKVAPRQLSLASVSNIKVKSKFGKDNTLSMFVSYCLSLSNALMASSDNRTAFSVAFKCLFNGAAILAKFLINFL